MKGEQLRAWEMVYNAASDEIKLLWLPIEKMSDGYATIAGELVPARHLALTPEDAKRRFIERVENGCKSLEATRDQAIAGLKANRGLLETAKTFPLAEAARLATKEDDKPAIIMPGNKDMH